MTRTKLCLLLEDFIELGGEAMEVVSGAQTPSETQSMARLCKQYNLLASRGSDFHSPGQPWATLGKTSELPADCVPVWSAAKLPAAPIPPRANTVYTCHRSIFLL